MKAIIPLASLSILMFFWGCNEKSTLIEDQSVKPRTIVTTDGEIDDVDSFIRMLLYSNEFRIEGLIYSSSMWHYKGDEKGTTFISKMEMTREIYGERTELRWPGTSWMENLIDAYDRVYPNLVLHSEEYPRPDELRELIRIGNIDFEGAMEKDTPGSDHIKQKLLDNDMTPLYLQAWGGTNTIARALKSIKEEYGSSDQWEQIYKKVSDKAIIYTILDQDATYYEYIVPNWPDVRVYYNSSQFWCFAYPWKQAVPDAWKSYLQGGFMEKHIVKGHGPLLEKYYTYGDGQQQEGDPEHIHGTDLKSFNETPLGRQWGPFDQYDFISEGDSPAFLHLVDVGLNNLNNPEYGGWGGRLMPSDSIPNRWEDGIRVSDWNPYRDTLDTTFPQTRWIPAIQEDFAARADWCIMSYEEANHPPEVLISQGNRIDVRKGDIIRLNARTSDPDGDNLNYKWWRYNEVDSYQGNIDLTGINSNNLEIKVPEDFHAGRTLHLILEVRDDAIHPMTRYARVILVGAD